MNSQLIMTSYLNTTYDIFRNIFKPFKQLQMNKMDNIDSKSFNLISRLPYMKDYKEHTFIPTLHQNSNNPKQALYFKKNIGCADDIVYQTTKEFNNDLNKNLVEYRALGFKDRLQQAMMTSARNPLCANAKYIIFTCNALGFKYGNSIIGILENEHPNADLGLTVEYELYNTVDNNK